MKGNETLFSVWLSLCTGVACTEFAPLIAKFGSAYALFCAREHEIEALDVSEGLKERLCNKNLDQSYGIVHFCDKHGVGILCYTDPAYPSTLRAIKAPPCVLYYKGKLPDFDKRLLISMVGTRSMSEYGREMAYRISYELASTGTIIVSGMALGVDAACAVGALAAKGNTIAVLGCGIDLPYPRQHDRLMQAIAEKGLVLTEFPPSTPPRGYHFPLRNRIISALGAGTLVVEANLGSGALITAKEAILQGKDIYAVPGNVGDPNTSGTNALIRDGAAVVLNSRDILQNYAFLYRDSVDSARLLRAQERSDPDPAAFARYGVGLPASHAPAMSVQQVRRTQIPQNKMPPKAANESAQQEKAAQKEQSASAQDSAEQVSAKQGASEQVSSEKVSSEKIAPTEHRDDSALVLEQFSQRQRDMFAQIPLDKAISADWLVRCGYAAHEVMMALTMFEIKGLISSLPGGLYTRK